MNETSRFTGAPTFCLRSKNLDASRAFYQALGLRVLDEVPGQRIVLGRGSFHIALMSFLDEDLLNLRGEDPFAIHAALKARGVAGPGEPERYAKEQYDADADGECWNTRDPDGRNVLFDTNEREKGPEAARRRLDQALHEAEQDLRDAGASEACLAAYREHVLEPFSPS